MSLLFLFSVAVDAVNILIWPRLASTMSGVRFKQKLDANVAQGLLSAQQPLRDIGYYLQ